MFKQGGMFSSWKRRLCVLVPTTLLFYFEDEEADSPSGVVVVDSHTDVSSLREEYDGKKFVVRVAPNVKGADTRAYYFQVRHGDCGAGARSPCEKDCETDEAQLAPCPPLRPVLCSAVPPRDERAHRPTASPPQVRG